MNYVTKLINKIGAMFLLVTLLAPIQASAGNFSYETFDAVTDMGGYHTTRAFGINNAGQVVGQWSFTAGGIPDGGSFLYSHGAFTYFNGPTGNQSIAFGINDAGQILGVYPNGAGGADGFVLSGGNYSIIRNPDANPNGGTYATGINNSGMVIGHFETGSSGYNASFVESGGVYTTLPLFPGIDPLDQVYTGFNDVGQFVGGYAENVNGGYRDHGFIERGGVFTTLDFPGVPDSYLTGINNLGQVTGYYENSTGVHGFVWSGGVFTTLDAPGGGSTYAYGINDLGQVVGYYGAGAGEYGFIATPDASPVPEPSTAILAGIGGIGIAIAVYRRRRTTVSLVV